MIRQKKRPADADTPGGAKTTNQPNNITIPPHCQSYPDPLTLDELRDCHKRWWLEMRHAKIIEDAARLKEATGRVWLYETRIARVRAWEDAHA